MAAWSEEQAAPLKVLKSSKIGCRLRIIINLGDS
jgi:hypothetical protein